MGIMVPWNITRKAPYSRYRERDIAGDYGIGNFWFVVRERTGDCGSWADISRGCSVPTSGSSPYFLRVPLDVNDEDINTSSLSDILQRAALCLGA